MSDLISFDYAIKYLLKEKGDYEIVEGFISALLCTAGYNPVKITALLESESNREVKYLKRSVADVIVADESGNNYIIEIDRAYTTNFIHKAVFNSSRLIVDNLSSNQDYLKIKKVFHINLLYFPFSDNKSEPLQHGKVIFHGINSHQPIDVHLADRKMNAIDLHNIFPEYFLISVPLFDDIIRREMDEWLYVVKNSKVREDFKSPYMKKLAERLNMLRMSEAEREEYDAYLMESMKGRDYLSSAEEKGRAAGIEEGIEKGIEKGRAVGIEEGIEKGKAEGIKEGIKEGVKQGKIEIAKNLLSQNMDSKTIAAVTGLSIMEIENL
jgi:predicted transposase/invertase (TIGR01784 family)